MNDQDTKIIQPLIISKAARVHVRIKAVLLVTAIVILYLDLVVVIWKSGHLIELLLFAMLLALHHLDSSPFSKK